MKEFYEKADDKVLTKCREFVERNINSTGDYYVYRSALSLFMQLVETLIESHKEFDDAIKNEINTINDLGDDNEKCISRFIFNQKNYCLYLDVEAHDVLDKLEIIEKNNRNK